MRRWLSRKVGENRLDRRMLDVWHVARGISAYKRRTAELWTAVQQRKTFKQYIAYLKQWFGTIMVILWPWLCVVAYGKPSSSAPVRISRPIICHSSLCSYRLTTSSLELSIFPFQSIPLSCFANFKPDSSTTVILFRSPRAHDVRHLTDVLVLYT